MAASRSSGTSWIRGESAGITQAPLFGESVGPANRRGKVAQLDGNCATIVGAMTERYVGQSLARREDRRLLTGSGQFIADLVLPGMLHAVFVRSQVAHARIRKVEVSRAAAAPGIAYVLTGAELQRL